MEVAGFADRKLKVKDDPYADANRRIEILLETR
jgi:chemotaxis protein MotB